jgi:hypothetical protein
MTTEVLPVERASQIKTKLIELGRQASNLILTNGLLLREYQSAGFYKEDGYKTFDEAIEAMKDAGQLDYGARQARHFVAIINMCDSLNINEAEVNKLGISRLREIASIKDPQQQLALLGSADGKSVADLQREAKAIRDKAAGREGDPLDPVTLLMTATQKQFYKDCIAAGRKMNGGKDPEAVPDVAILIDVILADWHSGLPEMA